MGNTERKAAEFLSGELVAANYAEFYRRVGETLRRHNESELTTSGALLRIRYFHALVRRCNLNLEVQRLLLRPQSRKAGGPDHYRGSGEQPHGEM